MDIDTLFQPRNFLNARAVPAFPLKDINASEDLLLKYLDALALITFDRYKKLTEMVEEYIIPEVAWLSYLFYLNKGNFVH